MTDRRTGGRDRRQPPSRFRLDNEVIEVTGPPGSVFQCHDPKSLVPLPIADNGGRRRDFATREWFDKAIPDCDFGPFYLERLSSAKEGMRAALRRNKEAK